MLTATEEGTHSTNQGIKFGWLLRISTGHPAAENIMPIMLALIDFYIRSVESHTSSNYSVTAEQVPPFHIPQLKPAIPAHWHPIPPTISPESINIDGQPTYRVKAPLNSRKRQYGLKYLVDCEVYCPDEQCWVLTHDILDPMLTNEFHTRHPKKTRPLPQDTLRKTSGPGVSALGVCHIHTKTTCELHFLRTLTDYNHG